MLVGVTSLGQHDISRYKIIQRNVTAPLFFQPLYYRIEH